MYGLIQPVTSPPAAPTSLTATATTSAGVHLAWVDNSDNEGGFRIERSSDNVNFAPLTTVGVDVRSCNDARSQCEHTLLLPSSGHERDRRLGVHTIRPSHDAAADWGDVLLSIRRWQRIRPRLTRQVETTAHSSARPRRSGSRPVKSAVPALSFSGDGVYNSANSQSAVSVQNGLVIGPRFVQHDGVLDSNNADRKQQPLASAGGDRR